jgi:hypothetical protein
VTQLFYDGFIQLFGVAGRACRCCSTRGCGWSSRWCAWFLQPVLARRHKNGVVAHVKETVGKIPGSFGRISLCQRRHHATATVEKGRDVTLKARSLDHPFPESRTLQVRPEITTAGVVAVADVRKAAYGTGIAKAGSPTLDRALPTSR